MNKRLLGTAAALMLLAAGCGARTPVGTGDSGGPDAPPDTPVNQPPAPGNPSTPGQQPGAPADLQSLKQEVQVAYRAVNTLRADYDNRQKKGSTSYFAKVKMTFAKPRKLRLDIKESSDALLSGAIVVWTGGPTLKGRKDIGFIPIKQEHKLGDKPNLRGWLYNQTDYDAMVSALLANMATAKLLGNTKIGGAPVVMVEFKSSLPGASIERIGIDPVRKLPIYREFRETPAGQPVFTTTYTNLQINSRVDPGAFSI